MSDYFIFCVSYLMNFDLCLTASSQLKASASILFVEFSSAFNNVQGSCKCNCLSYLCQIQSAGFLRNRRQQVWLEKHFSDIRTVSTRMSLGCALSPLLLSLHTNDCISRVPAVKILTTLWLV